MKTQIKKFHFIGIGGAGMSGLAEILLQLGHQVSGSDREASELTHYLAEKGARIHIGHEAGNVGDADFVVYSSAIPKSNPEMEKAFKNGIECLRRAEMLGQLFNRKFGIGIAGTHGKTTTTSMLGSILLQTELDPTIIVGGKFQNLLTNARLGYGEVLVAEADEYDRSFLALQPRIAILTSLEADHLDIYKDLDDLRDTFNQYCRQVTFDGTIIINKDEPELQNLLPQLSRTVITYGVKSDCDLKAANIHQQQGHSTADLLWQGTLLGSITLTVPGEHNIKNALAATTAALTLDVPFEKIQAGLAAFKGVGRRFEILGEVQQITVVDDYAHHPTELSAALQAAQTGWDKRLVAVFQPHLYSRTRDFAREFASALSVADLAVVTDIYPAREEPIAGVSGKLIADRLSNTHLYIEQKSELIDRLLPHLQPNDLVMFLGAGDIWNYSRQLLKQLQMQN